MKILILTEFFAPAWAFGGPPKALFELSKELVKKEHRVTVIATNVLDDKNEISKFYDNLNGINVYYLKTYSKWLAYNEKIFLPIGLNKLLNKIVGDFDLFMLASYRTLFNWESYRSAKKFNKPYVLLPYGSLPRGSGIKKIVKWAIDPLFGYSMLKGASLVLAQTNHEMLESIKYGAKAPNVKLLPLNVDLSEFDDLPSKGTLRRRYGLKQDEKIVLFLGRLHKYKGLELLIESFAQLVNIKQNYKLIIVGRDDGYLKDMFKLIKDLELEGKVIFAGALYGRDRIKAYVDADVFVMPSLHFEETSTAALEACASSTPVIITKQASIPGLEEYQAGLTINYDENELQDALLKILENDDRRIQMGKNARKMIKEIYSSASWVNRFQTLLRASGTCEVQSCQKV